ncbi:MAG: NAD(+) synthase [Clostridia bacterium]|nr:NAD(+) synthase [Clostridia bacterium]
MEKTINDLIEWIKNYVNQAHANGVVLGMSGGKDSLICAKLCIEALGNDKVFGVIMPNGKMQDKDDAVRTCKLLNMPFTTIDISTASNSIIENVTLTLKDLNKNLTDVTTINTPPRVRMTYLYAIGGSLNYLVANTSNLSEISVGYSTKWGDSVGDFAPLASFTKTEVCKIGRMLDLPIELVEKIPSDGLSGKSDEEKMGLSYKNLDSYIRTGIKNEDYDQIIRLNKITRHKRNPIAKFNNGLKNFLGE